MTPLMPCPRCTQSLPVTAGFCRRCGFAVRAGARPPVPAAVARGGRSWFWPGLAIAGGVASLVVVGAVGLLAVLAPAHQQVAPSATVSVPTPPVPYAMPALPPPRVIFPTNLPHVYPPSAAVPPGYAAQRGFTPAYPAGPVSPRQTWVVEQPPSYRRR